MKNFKLIDCHAHVNSEFSKENYPEVLRRALETGIAVVNVGTNKKDSEENVKIAESFKEGVFATVGMHPTEEEKINYDFFRKLAENKKVVAVGECGLDYFRVKDDEFKIREIERQKDLFKEQIKLAKEVGKPLMLHLRTAEAYRDALEILRQAQDLKMPKIIFHFYSGGEEFLERALKLDAYFTFGGTLTFKMKGGEKNEYEEVIKKVPKDRILLETDAPFVAPEPNRGKRNEPIMIVETAKKAAEILEMELEEFLEIEKKNAENVFGVKL
ncbi:MAG: TatD family hydrolase [Candidatus Paceibacterota bacterium]